MVTFENLTLRARLRANTDVTWIRTTDNYEINKLMQGMHMFEFISVTALLLDNYSIAYIYNSTS